MIIMTLIAGLLVGSFHTGLMCYRKTNAYEKSAMKLTGALSMLKEDARRFVPIDNKNVCFKEDEITFYIVSSTPSSHLEQVSYSVKNGLLKRSILSNGEKDFTEQAAKSNSTIILRGIKDWVFSYTIGTVPRGSQEKNKLKIKKKSPSPHEKLYWPAAIKIVSLIKDKERDKFIATSILLPEFGVADAGSAKSDKKASKPQSPNKKSP